MHQPGCHCGRLTACVSIGLAHSPPGRTSEAGQPLWARRAHGQSLGDECLASEQHCPQGSCISTWVSKYVPLHLMTIRKENVFECPFAHLNSSSPPERERHTSSQNFHLVPLTTQAPPILIIKNNKFVKKAAFSLTSESCRVRLCADLCARVSTPGSYTGCSSF